jgi:Glycosyl transferases group 1
MQAGLPVVASAVGDMRELVVRQKLGLTVPPNDPQALAAAILAMLDSPGLQAPSVPPLITAEGIARTLIGGLVGRQHLSDGSNLEADWQSDSWRLGERNFSRCPIVNFEPMGSLRISNIKDAGFRIYSQFEEDGIILYVLSTIGFNTRRAVEICCGSGNECCGLANQSFKPRHGHFDSGCCGLAH